MYANMDRPKRCWSCGMPLPEKYFNLYFDLLRAKKVTETEAFQMLQQALLEEEIDKSCCWRMIITSRPCASELLFLKNYKKEA